MKKIILKTIFSLTVLASMSFVSNDNVHIKVNKEAKIFSVHHNASGLIRVRIKDNNGITLYKISPSKNEGFLKVFDLSHVPTGNYYLIVEDEQNTHTYELNISAESLMYDKKNTSKNF